MAHIICRCMSCLEHSFMQRPVHLSFGRVNLFCMGRNMTGRVMDGEKSLQKS